MNDTTSGLHWLSLPHVNNAAKRRQEEYRLKTGAYDNVCLS